MKKTLRLWFLPLSGLAMMTFILSCSSLPSTPVAALPVESTESTPSPATAGEVPTILTDQDSILPVGGDPAQIDNSDFPITPVEYLGVTGSAPEVDIAGYVLSVDGLVDTPLALSYEDILKYPAISEVVLLVCPGFFEDNAEWTGVPVTVLLTEAGIKPEASQVTFHAIDGFQQTFPIRDVQQDGVFLAYTVNGQILPKEHGYPVRLVIRGKYGSNWVKWVNHIEVK